MKNTVTPQAVEELSRLGFDTATIAYEQLGSLIAVIDAIAEIAQVKAELVEETGWQTWFAVANIAKLGQECGENYRSTMFDFKAQFDGELKAAKESGK